jgi:aerobic C4-dicarboxylate transport protein
LFLAHALNVHLTVTEQFTTLLVMLFTSKGAAGVTGGGFVALAATLPAVNLVPVGSLSLLVGVDRFMAEIRAATNLTSNIIATLVVARWSGAVDCDYARQVLERRRNDQKLTPPLGVSADSCARCASAAFCRHARLSLSPRGGRWETRLSSMRADNHYLFT